MFEYLQLRRNKVFRFKPKIEIVSDKGPFVLKTVSNADELIEALRLRYEVFHHEMIGKSKATGIDVDEFDFICDHLIIKDKKSNKIVGTYRLNSSLFSNRFYSAQEFNLRPILETEGNKLELGRACIHKDFRRGIVISLLWRGIAEYMNATNTETLFGCASIKTASPRQAALLYRHFQLQGRFKEGMICPPTLDFSMRNIDLWIHHFNRPLNIEEQTEVEELLPSLCRAYLNAGAILGGEPAFDKEFQCIDFLTIMKRENLHKALWRKYSQKTAGEETCQENPAMSS